MTEAPVVSSTTQTTAHIPPLTSQTLTSESSSQTPSSNTTSASSPANTSSSPTDTSTSREPDSQTNQTHNATSPPTTAPNTTVITTIPASTPAPPPPQYNDKALIGSLVFLIILIPVALLFYKIYIRKCRKSHDVNDDMMLESEAIYVNARPPGWRHREAR
ncbi:uncharacterized protein LOC127349797 [Dicentrarchus labrax]|uniref:uncharacterized protein LOC127349797 n=1 Tax=Dicentrarchus labrax TaxID=13489 RepID=UPI0021F5317F|nr:uncharacterized protein LOC127349797 [Dicentrarchus labrax]